MTETPIMSSSMYYFCFFCGKPLGPAKDHKHIEQLAKEKDFKRRPHYAYKGERGYATVVELFTNMESSTDTSYRNLALINQPFF